MSTDAVNFLKAVFSNKPADQYVHLWTKTPGKEPSKQSFFFRRLKQVVEIVERRQDRDVWIGCGTRTTALSSPLRGELEDIAGIPGLWGDIDIAGVGHKKAGLPPTIEDALSLLADLPDPTLIVNSGHGLQPWWLFNDFWTFRDSTDRAQAAALSAAWGQRLTAAATARGWTLDSVFDLPRILRMPGTMNHKGKPVPAIMHSNGGPRYALEDFGPIPEPPVQAVLPAMPSVRVSADTILSKYIDLARAGNRNDTGLGLAVQLRDNGYSYSEAEPYIRQYASVVSHLGVEEYTADEALASLRSAYKRPAREAWSSPGEDSASVSIEEALHFTDLGNARRLVRTYGQDIQYCHPWHKWLVWDGARWAQDSTAEISRRAKDTVAGIYVEAARLQGDERKDLAKHALKSEAVSRIDAMLSLAESEPGIPILPEYLDRDIWALNVRNGTIDLRTGAIKPHSRGEFITKLAPVTFDPQATCPSWMAFLDRIMAGNHNLIRFLQRAVGYSLTGDTSERVLFILYGCGANGKSTFLDIVQALMGSQDGYSMRTPTETLLVKRNEGIPNDVARLKGARFVFASETEQDRRLAESLVKDLTGGDIISARFMRGEWFDFQPEFKLWLGTNHKPVIRGTDNAIWDRLKLVPFNITIPVSERVPRRLLLPQLCGELPGILNWALAGCLEWQNKGLGVPDEVTAATQGYREEMDVLAVFLADCCDISAMARITSKALYDSYKAWCEDNGERVLSQRAIGSLLVERGFRRGHSMGIRLWKGFALTGQEQYPEDDSEDGNEALGTLGTHEDAVSTINKATNYSHEEIPKMAPLSVPCVPQPPYWTGDDDDDDLSGFDPYGNDTTARILALAEAAGWPRLEIHPGSTIPAGQDSWTTWVGCGRNENHYTWAQESLERLNSNR